jgi:hypothetical protein
MKETTQPTNGYKQSELRFILVNGLAKAGTAFGVVTFLGNYISQFGFSLPNSSSGDFWYLAYKSVIGGAFFGLSLGLFLWRYQIKKNPK